MDVYPMVIRNANYDATRNELDFKVDKKLNDYNKENLTIFLTNSDIDGDVLVSRNKDMSKPYKFSYHIYNRNSSYLDFDNKDRNNGTFHEFLKGIFVSNTALSKNKYHFPYSDQTNVNDYTTLYIVHLTTICKTLNSNPNKDERDAVGMYLNQHKHLLSEQCKKELEKYHERNVVNASDEILEGGRLENLPNLNQSVFDYLNHNFKSRKSPKKINTKQKY